MPVTGVVSLVDSTHPPYLELDTFPAVVLYWLTESGGFPGAIFVVLLALIVFVVRPGSTRRTMALEAILCVVLVTLFAGGGTKLNEHEVKDRFAVPRPNIVDLVALGVLPDTPTAEFFYDKYPTKEARGVAIEQVFDSASPPLEMGPLVLEHWTKETAYSFPSGHAYAVMLIATFFLALALTFISGPRLFFFYALTLWAVAVCYSRPLLRVHTPVDITVGGIAGVLAGLLAFLVFRKIRGQSIV